MLRVGGEGLFRVMCMSGMEDYSVEYRGALGGCRGSEVVNTFPILELFT